MRLVRAHVVMRHGDRTPVFNCWEPFATAAEESWAWARKLPSRGAVARLENGFAIEHDDASSSSSTAGVAKDAAMGVYGSLTRRGLMQTSAVGKALRERLFYPEIETHGSVKASDVFVYSSNFDRTKRSAASAVRAFIDEEETERVRMRVVEGAADHINVYPHIPALRRRMQSIIADPGNETGIQRAEMAMAPLRMSLQAYIPAFSMFIAPFSWINAADHFTCRQVRSGGSEYAVDPLSLFGDADADGNGEICLEELRAVVDGVCEPPISDDDMKRMHDSVSNGKGAIRFEEFADFVKRPLPPIPEADLDKISEAAQSASLHRRWHRSRISRRRFKQSCCRGDCRAPVQTLPRVVPR